MTSRPASPTAARTGSSQTTSYTYDPAGNVLTQSATDPGSGGPAAWYSLSQASGTAVPDGISGGQPATASGVTWDGTEGTFTGAAGSQVATAGPVLDTTASFTVSAWVNLAANNRGHPQVAVSQAAGTASGFSLGYDQASGDWQFGRALDRRRQPVVRQRDSSATRGDRHVGVPDGQFNANTGAMALYVNGASAGEATDAHARSPRTAR